MECFVVRFVDSDIFAVFANDLASGGVVKKKEMDKIEG